LFNRQGVDAPYIEQPCGFMHDADDAHPMAGEQASPCLIGENERLCADDGEFTFLGRAGGDRSRDVDLSRVEGPQNGISRRRKKFLDHKGT
jgi:hypothetical protein